jgi:hypothetical protein
MILGGPALFLAGHAASSGWCGVTYGGPGWSGSSCSRCWPLAARTISELALSACAAGVVAGVAATDRLPWLPHPRPELAPSTSTSTSPSGDAPQSPAW